MRGATAARRARTFPGDGPLHELIGRELDPARHLPPRFASEPALRPDRLEVVDVLPLADHLALAVATSPDERLSAVPLDLRTGERATAGSGAAEALLGLAGAERDTGAFDVVLLDPPPPVHGERPVPASQSHESVVVGDRVVVKWVAGSWPGDHAGDLALRHLAAVGFDHMPASHLVVSWGDAVLVLATGWLPGAVDGNRRWLDTPELHRFELARAMGDLTGHLHRALASPSAVVKEPVGQAPAAVWADQAAGLLAGSAPLLKPDWHRRLAPVVDQAIDRLTTGPLRGLQVPVTLVHGDLTPGELLTTGHQLVVIDLDGDPFVPRIGLEPPWLDLASLLSSLDHLGATPDQVDALLDAYRATGAPGSDPAWLGPARLWRAARTLNYAARVDPDWLPTAAAELERGLAAACAEHHP